MEDYDARVNLVMSTSADPSISAADNAEESLYWNDT
jgi:hypothetical protein